MVKYLGISDIVLDVYYDTQNNVVGYYPGGSVWNDLMNLHELNPLAELIGIATVGNDVAGTFALSELKKSMIEFQHLECINKQSNRFNIVLNGEKTNSKCKCPLCNKKLNYRSSKFDCIDAAKYSLSSSDFGIVIIDSLRKDILKLAFKLKQCGWKLALDLGYSSSFRYLSTEEIIDKLNVGIDYLQTKPSVLEQLLNRLGHQNVQQLMEKYDFTFINITDGEKGAQLTFRTGLNFSTLHSLPESTDVNDPTGAGDAYFSMLLSQVHNNEYQRKISDIQQKAAIFSAQRISEIGAVGRTVSMVNFDGDYCKGCGASNSSVLNTRLTKYQIEINVKKLPMKIYESLHTKASNLIRDFIRDTAGLVYIIGTGGTFTAAIGVSKILNFYEKNIIAIPKQPRDFMCNNNVEKAYSVVLLSSSGKTPDITRIYTYCKENNIRVCVITNLSESNSIKYYSSGDIISYNSSLYKGRERGFISCFGTLAPIVLVAENYYHNEKDTFIDFLKNSFDKWEKYWEHVDLQIDAPNLKTIDIFSGDDTIMGAADIESKIIEAGIGRVTLHEKKGFSHGRFNIVHANPPTALIFFENISGKYSKKLLSHLSQECCNKEIIISSSIKHVIWGDIDLLIGSQYFSLFISKQIGFDISKPGYLKEDMRLYKYQGELL